MADIHVTAGDGNQAWRIVIHIPVPDTPNSASVNWRIALINSGMGGNTALPDGDGTAGTISATEKAKLVTGELLEHSFAMEIDGSGSTPVAQAAALRVRAAAEKTARLVQVQRILKHYGQTLTES